MKWEIVQQYKYTCMHLIVKTIFAALPTANAGQYANSNYCKPLPFWFPCSGC